MKRTTITLPDDLAAALDREARRRRTSHSAVVREALAASLGTNQEKRVLPFVALGRSEHRTTARDMEELMAEEWTEDGLMR